MAQATGFASESRSWREKQQQLSGVVNTKPGPVPPLLRRPASRRNQQQLQFGGVKRVSSAASAGASFGVFGSQPSDQWCVRRVTVVRYDHDGERITFATPAGTVAKLQHVHGRHGALAEWHQQQKRYNR